MAAGGTCQRLKGAAKVFRRTASRFEAMAEENRPVSLGFLAVSGLLRLFLGRRGLVSAAKLRTNARN